MEKKDYLVLIIFALFLMLFALFSLKINFHDSYEYITIAKHFAGIENVNIFSGHSLVYPLTMSFFIKIMPNLLAVKLFNTFWVFLIALIFLFWLKNRWAFALFVFSPLTWVASIQTTPILPASFFFFLAFIFLKKRNLNYNLFYSGLFLGISAAFYTPMIIIGLLFALIYFFDKSFLEFLAYFISIFIGFFPRLILDYWLFDFPIYSLFRYFGANAIILMGMNPATSNIHILSNLKVLLIFLIISPFLYKLIKIDFKKYSRELVFLGLSFLIFILRAALFKYFLIISPIIILLLVNHLNKREIKWHCIISIVLILFLTWNYFTWDNDNLVKQDINSIINERESEYIIAGPIEALKLATFSWQNKPHFVWWQDFDASLKNEIEIRGYDFSFNSKIPLKNKLKISASFNRFENKTYGDYIIVTEKTEDEFSQLPEYELKKCYEVLCVYE